MAAKTLDLEGAKSAKIGVIEDAEYGRQAVHDVVVALHANRRQGSANTKTRGEVAATGKKPFRQKGTGRARQGTSRAVQHRGGGVVHGPHNRSHAHKLPKKVRRAALKSALSRRTEENALTIFEAFELSEIKTRGFLK